MEFRSVDQLNRDIAAWALALPREIDLVVGIPQRGLLAATLLALWLQRPVTDLDGLLAGRTLGFGKRMTEFSGADVVAHARRILIVDDSTNRGGAIREARRGWLITPTPSATVRRRRPGSQRPGSATAPS